ncbi:RES family NAD+ phosphorylase [Mesorhizobium sp.]|uniref:RES family NAD+ phosphorylase n=1 Tax=Mesorhizobium sp. TaxID=1871066 RepID=UPI0012007CE3|nr:RES family NAD+ phosphorylase [Mesorhizobium sp.]TIL25473.1 MAG: RES domain-containing protein [Mesorhizobium sp.]TIR29945.1 MAG: RES domain-containing protein [Mesorhizobium sp.]
MSAPLPPADIARREPELIIVAAGTSIHRFFTAKYDPIYFDKSRDGRLNAPDASYGVLYAARDATGAFAETFLRRPGRTLLDLDLLRQKAYARLSITAELKLMKLAGPGLAVLGATAEVVHGGLPYDVPQAWSKALSAHFDADGIAYYARHDDEALCYALFDRAAHAVREEERTVDLDADWFWALAKRYKIGLAPQ